jgi:hypothetical protein
MGFRGAVFGFLIGESLAARSGIVCAECDPAKPVEPIASRFEMRGDTVYDRRTGLTWMRCSYGQAWTESRGLLRRGQTPGLGRGNGIALARKHRLETSPEGRVGEHCSDQLQAARDRRNGVSRYAVDSVLDDHADRPVLCLGGFLSDRHVDVEFPPRDALCCSAGPNWPMNDTGLGTRHDRPPAPTRRSHSSPARAAPSSIWSDAEFNSRDFLADSPVTRFRRRDQPGRTKAARNSTEPEWNGVISFNRACSAPPRQSLAQPRP